MIGKTKIDASQQAIRPTKYDHYFHFTCLWLHITLSEENDNVFLVHFAFSYRGMTGNVRYKSFMKRCTDYCILS